MLSKTSRAAVWLTITFMGIFASPLLADAPAMRFNVRDFGALADGKTDDGPAINRAVEAAKKAGGKTVVFLPAGTYRLGSYTLRHDPKAPSGPPHIQILDARDLTLEGEKGTLLLSADSQRAFVFVRNSSNVTVRQLTLDADPLLYTQGTVESVDTPSRTMLLTVDEGFDELDREDFLTFNEVRVLTDVAHNAWTLESWFPRIEKRERVGERRWKVTMAPNAIRPEFAGKKWVMWQNRYRGMFVDFDSCTDGTVEDVTAYSGNCFSAWRCRGTMTFRRCTIGVPPGSNRLFAASGGMMCFFNRATVVVEDCDFSRVDDDCLNMGTNFIKVLRQVDEKTAIVKDTPVIFEAGDSIAVWDWQAKQQRDEVKLAAFSRLPDRTVQLTFERAVKFERTGPGADDSDRRAQEKDGVDRIVDMQSGGRAIVRRNRFNCRRARAVLMKSQGSLIEENTFYDMHMPAILAGPEFYWSEAPPVRNLTIRHNRFVNNDVSNIYVACFESQASRDNRNIVIEGNRFEGYGRFPSVARQGRQGVAVHVSNAEGVTIRGNTFGAAAPTAPQDAPRVLVEHSRHVRLGDNTGLSPDSIANQADEVAPSKAAP